MSLRARLTTFVAVAVGLAVAVIAFFAYGFARDEARLEDDRFLVERGPAVGIFGSLDIEDIGRRPGLFGGPGQGAGAGSGPAQESDRTAPVGDIIREDAVAQFIDAGGFVLRFGEFGVVLPVDAADLELASNPGPDLLRDVVVDSVHYRMLTRHLGPGLAIQVARDVSGTDAILSGLRLRLTLLGILGAAAAAVVGWFVSRRSLRPVGLLTDAAEHVAATHDLEARIDLGREDELGRLAAAFNTMLAALEEARISQQRLVTDASHELRTPLTSLRTNIELLAMGGVRDEDRSELMADLTSEVGELSHLVSELVDLATIGRDEEPRVELDVRVIVEQAIERLRRRTDLTIEAELEPTVIIGRPGGILRAVSNLLDNAAKWGSDGALLEIRLRDHEFSVRDHGPGVPEEDLGHVFKRFYRSPQARSRPGSGLGLSIVDAVTTDHGGEVFVRNAADGGAIVGFSLPISAE